MIELPLFNEEPVRRAANARDCRWGNVFVQDWADTLNVADNLLNEEPIIEVPTFSPFLVVDNWESLNAIEAPQTGTIVFRQDIRQYYAFNGIEWLDLAIGAVHEPEYTL